MVMELVERNLVKAVGAGGSTDGAVDPFAAGFRRVHQVRVSICTQKRVRLLLLLIGNGMQWSPHRMRSYSQMTPAERGGIGKFLTEEGRIREFGTDKGEGVKNPDVIFEGPHITN